MKKILLTTVALGAVLSCSAPAFASSPEDPSAISGGGVQILENNILKPIGIQERKPAGGGDFEAWVSGFKVHARYDHRTRTHSATAKNGEGGQVRDKQGPGRRAYAITKASISGNTGWWNVY